MPRRSVCSLRARRATSGDGSLASSSRAGVRVRCLARTPESSMRSRGAPTSKWLPATSSTAPRSPERFAKSTRPTTWSIRSDPVPTGSSATARAAENFRDAAADAGVEQIVYLGGLGDDAGGALSPHLASRHEVGRVLAAGPVPVTELRAAVVIGSGSASFEMLRHLVEVLPVMTTPRWVQTRVQPIAVSDVLAYLTGVLGNRDASRRGVRDRRRRRRHLPGDDGRVRVGRRAPQAGDHSGAGVEPAARRRFGSGS